MNSGTASSGYGVIPATMRWAPIARLLLVMRYSVTSEAPASAKPMGIRARIPPPNDPRSIPPMSVVPFPTQRAWSAGSTSTVAGAMNRRTSTSSWKMKLSPNPMGTASICHPDEIPRLGSLRWEEVPSISIP